jgi:prepilin-type N-terminal cleavage/methylation domain-containing protein
LVQRELRCRSGLAKTAECGFTFIEVMIALSISVVVLLANLYLFNIAHRDLALARSITAATNLATGKIADLRARVINAPLCFDAATTVPNSKWENYGFTGNGSPCTRPGTTGSISPNNTGDLNPDYPGLVNEDLCSPPSSRDRDFPFKEAGWHPPPTPWIPPAPLCTSPGVRNPLFVSGARKVVPITITETTTVDGIVFTSTAVLSDVDLQHDGFPDMKDEVMKITVDVGWTLADKPHHVGMTTFTTGKAP